MVRYNIQVVANTRDLILFFISDLRCYPKSFAFLYSIVNILLLDPFLT